jgi:hypothetical protein
VELIIQDAYPEMNQALDERLLIQLNDRKNLGFKSLFRLDTGAAARVGTSEKTGLINRLLILNHHVNWRFSDYQKLKSLRCSVE